MEESQESYTLVARKPSFGLPTACPHCLPVYIYLKLARFPFDLAFNPTYPDSDQIPYVESDSYVAYNNENGGVIQRLKEDGIVDLDAEFSSVPEWISMEGMISSWLADAIMYELWVGSDGSAASKIYYADVPWIIGKVLFMKQVYTVKQRLGITKDTAEQREKEIYKRARQAYGALSTTLGDQVFLFDNRPSSLDAFLIGHVLLTLQALPETSLLRNMFLEHDNLVRYADKFKAEFMESGTASGLQSHTDSPRTVPRSHPSTSGSQSHTDSPRTVPRSRPSSSKPKAKPKKEQSEEEKKFKRRAKIFLVTQMVAVLVFLSVMGGYDFSEVDVDVDDED